jgi:hypothetical protein
MPPYPPVAARTIRAAAAAALIGVALFTGGASAAPWYCGDRQVVHADRVVNPGGRAPLAIGDSVMLPTVFRLAHEGYKADARGCRTMGEGLRILRRVKRNRGGLPHLVVVALGAGWPIHRHAIREALDILGPRRVLALVTPHNLPGTADDDRSNILWAARRYPGRVTVLDWVAHSRGHSGWFVPDGAHLTFPGQRAYARFLRGALRWARPR